MVSANFYADLPPIYEFGQITESNHFRPAPKSWYLIITDIVNSTKYIDLGQYKDVNLLGACTIVAILNIASKIEIPFVFGGDGAALLIPPELYKNAADTLGGIQYLAKNSYGMELRAGIVPVQELKYPLDIAKLQISPNYHQAIFKGGGLTYGTSLLKSTQKYHVPPQEEVLPDLSGLECRWQDIHSSQGEILSLIVQIGATTKLAEDYIYRSVINQIQAIYGSEHSLNPASPKELHLTFNPVKLAVETKAKSFKRQWWLFRLLQITVEVLLGWILMSLKVKMPTIDWAEYKNIVTATTDYRKFDDALRMVITTTTSQRRALIDYLEIESAQGNVVYGFHVTDRALMTCLVFERAGRQVHFIDGADGGYAYAAKVLKAKFTLPVLWKLPLIMLVRFMGSAKYCMKLV